MPALKATGASPTLNFRLNLTPAERSTLELVALDYGMSKSCYVEACLKDKRRLGRIARGMAHDQGDLRALVTLRLDEKVVDDARGEARKLGFTNFSEYVRQKTSSGLSRRPPPRSGYARRGRPSRVERLRTMAGERGLDELQVMLMDVDGLKALVLGVYELLAKVGVRPGDKEALFELTRRLVDYRVRHVPAAGDVSGRREVVLKAWSPRHGFVEIEVPPPEALAGIKSVLKR